VNITDDDDDDDDDDVDITGCFKATRPENMG
jgi:hypothetical protein